MSQQNHQIYEFGPFHLDATKRVLLKEGEPQKLFPKEFDTLLALVERSGELLEKDDLMRTVWNDAIVEESNLATNISHLRKVLGETRDKHDYIVTVPGRGYRFVAGVTQCFDELIVRDRTRVIVEEEENGSSTIGSMSTGPAYSITTGFDLPELSRFPAIKGIPGTARSEYLGEQTRLQSLPVATAGRRTAQFWLVIGTLIVSVTGSAFLLARFVRLTNSPTQFQTVTLKQLTSNSKATLATLSPDGKLFAYASREAGNEGLWLGSVSGSEAVCLRRYADVTYRSLNFSPDGSTLFYVAFGNEYPHGALFRIPVLGGVPEKLHDKITTRVAFSPSMKQFAFIRLNTETKTSSLVIANTDSSGERTIVSRPESLPFRSLSPSWSPDGTKIAVSAATNETGESYEVFIVSVSDGRISLLTTAAWFHVASTLWLPDMSGLVVIGKEKGTWEAFQLWNISYPQGTPQQILSDLDNYGSALSISADGRLLAVVQEQKETNVWVANSTSLENAKQITFGSVGRRDGWTNLDWTVDGKLVYGAIIRDSLTIWTMDSNGDNQRQLTSRGYRDSNVSVTADGRYMVFRSNRSGHYEIWRARIDGSDMQQLTNAGHNSEPHISPDGKWVVFTSLRDGLTTLWRVSIDGGNPVQLTDKLAGSPGVSHDGKLIACSYMKQADQSTQLAIISAEGGPPLKLFDLPRLANLGLGVRWTPDDKAVTYRDWSNGIWRQPVEGGQPQRLKGLPEEKLYSYAWSRDGKQFAFVRGSETRDVVLLQINK